MVNGRSRLWPNSRRHRRIHDGLAIAHPTKRADEAAAGFGRRPPPPLAHPDNVPTRPRRSWGCRSGVRQPEHRGCRAAAKSAKPVSLCPPSLVRAVPPMTRSARTLRAASSYFSGRSATGKGHRGRHAASCAFDTLVDRVTGEDHPGVVDQAERTDQRLGSTSSGAGDQCAHHRDHDARRHAEAPHHEAITISTSPPTTRAARIVRSPKSTGTVCRPG